MPQTREHFAICRLLQIPAGLIALTKSDLVDADTLELARLDARELVAGSALADAPIVAVSAKTGDGLDALRARARGDRRRALRERAGDGPPRLPIDRVFSMRGLRDGRDRHADERDAARRRRAGGAARGTAGSRCAACRSTARRSRPPTRGAAWPSTWAASTSADLSRGDTLTARARSRSRGASTRVIDLLPDAKPLRHGARVRFHHGTTELLGRVALAAEATDITDRSVATENTEDTDRKPVTAGLTELQPGRRAYARVRLEAPAVLTRGDRFILRQYSPAITIAGGRVLDPVAGADADPDAPRVRRGSRAWMRATPSAVPAFVEERRGAGLTLDALARRAGLTPRRGDGGVGRAGEGGNACVAVGSEVVQRADRGRARAEAAGGHRRAPSRQPDVGRAAARRGARAALRPRVAGAVRGRAAAAGRAADSWPVAIAWRSRAASVSLTPEEARAQEGLDRIFREAGLAPPDLAAAAAAAGVAAPVADRVAKLLIRQKTLVKVDTLLFHAGALDRLKQDVKALKAQGGPAKVDVAGFKERYGVSRKYAIPLLEWLDRERVTRRVGDARVIL